MRYLLDTHVFLWWLNDDKRLRTRVKEVIQNGGDSVYVSVVCAWEISIKLKTNPAFKLRTTITKTFELASFPVVDICLRHVVRLNSLPMYHKDPFDRMLIAQALEDDMVLVTDDPKIKRYSIHVLT